MNRIYAAKDGSLKEYTYTPTTSAPFAAQLLPAASSNGPQHPAVFMTSSGPAT